VYELHTHTDIAAPATVIWRILTELDAYPRWNPFIKSIAGDIAVGERLEVVLQPPGGKPMTFKPTIVHVDPGRGFTWLGRLFGIPRLFDGEHSLRIESVDPDVVRFVHGERFGGVLVPFLRKMLDGPTREGFEAMNRALKTRAEEQASLERTARGP